MMPVSSVHSGMCTCSVNWKRWVKRTQNTYFLQLLHYQKALSGLRAQTVEAARVRILGLVPAGCVTLTKSFKLSMPQFSDL